MVDARREPLGFTSPSGNQQFFGRRDEMRRLEVGFADHAVVTLVGVGGCGKTRIAERFWASHGTSYGDGVVFVDLAPVASANLLAASVAVGARAFDQSPEGGGHESDEGRLIDVLSRRHQLVVLDNCEHLVADCSRLVARVVERCPRVQVLATSREPLGLRSELRINVGPLDLDAACGLFLARARAVGALIDPDRDRPTVESICVRLDCLALAIELAAASVRMMGLDELLARIDDSLPLLVSAERWPDPRQATMTAALDWSLRLLEEEEQRVFVALGVFVGGWTLDAAEAICATRSTATAHHVAALVDHSLVTFEGGDRYRLLEPVRQYAWTRLNEGGDAAELISRHRRHYRRVARSLNARALTSGLTSSDRAELPNFRAAIDRALDLGDGNAALTVFVSLGWYWVLTGFWREAVERGQRGIQLAVGCDPSTELLAQSMVAGFLAYSGRPRSAEPHVQRALGLLDSSPGDYGSRYLLSTALESLGSSPVEILEHAERAAEAAGDRAFAAYIAHSLARYHMLMWQLDDAGEPLDRALSHAAGTDLAFAGAIEAQAEALRCFREDAQPGRTQAPVAHDMGDVRPGSSLDHESRALALAVSGMADQAARMIGIECRRAAKGGWMQRVVLHLHLAAVARARVGQCDLAVTLAETAEHQRRRLGYAPIPLMAHLGRRDLDRARAMIGAAGADRAGRRGRRLTGAEAVELAASPIPSSGCGPLSSREAEVMALLGAGLENRDIADLLFISPRTVDAHLSHIRSKLGISGRAHLVRWAIEHGLATTSGSPAEFRGT